MTEASVPERVYTTVDKSAWGDGPWNDEPDKVQWTDPETGLPCLATRNHLGAWCGYVGIAEGHPLFEKSYWDADMDVHGGLTYADHCDEGPEETSICHIPAPGEPDHVWWFGFDCAHGSDVAPGMEARERELGFPPLRMEHAIYRSLGYVRSECASLAQQLTRAASQPPAEGET